MTARGAAAIAAATLLCLVGCGGAPSQLAPVTPSQAGARAGARPGTWMAPEAKSRDLLYVADLNNNAVYVYTFPGAQLVGTLTGFSAPHGECTDAAGNVYVTNGNAGTIVEYAHGGTQPIATLADPGYYPHNCAVDPATGNLAVMNLPTKYGPGNLVIYDHAKGKPHAVAASPIAFYYFGTYDRQGNLFLDGTLAQHAIFKFGELPAGKRKVNMIALDRTFVLPGAIQWVGSTLVVGDQENISGPSALYRFRLNGITGKRIGSIPLTDSCDVLQFRIAGTRIVAADDCGATVRYFDYPRGGDSTKTIADGLSQPVGIAISRTP